MECLINLYPKLPNSRERLSSNLKTAYLKHLDERDGEIEVGLVSQDQTTAEEEANREDGAQKDFFGNVHIFDAIEEVRRSLQHTCANGLLDDGHRLRVRSRVKIF